MVADQKNLSEKGCPETGWSFLLNRPEKVEWFLIHHPILALTPIQLEIYQRLKSITPKEINVWKAKFGREKGVSRQNICNIVRTVKRKVEFAENLVELLEGDVIGFFEKYKQDWRPPLLRQGLWNLLKPGHTIPDSIRKRLAELSAPMRELAHDLISQQSQNARVGRLQPERLAQTFHLLVTAVYAQPARAADWLLDLSEEISGKSWIIDRFINQGLFRLDNKDIRDEYIERLKYLSQSTDDESYRFANYFESYYSGDKITSEYFLASDGNTRISDLEIGPVVKATYENITEKLYNQSEALLDINFLRFLVVHNIRRQAKLAAPTRNSLKTICQKSLHSSDPFVAGEAEKLLARVS